MKEIFYFPHDNNAHNDPKLMAVFMDLGLAGVGMFWILIELLHQQENGIIEEVHFDNYVKFYTGGTNVEQMLNKLKTSGLFCIENGKVYSKRVLENKEFREDLKEKRRLAGIESAKKRASQRQESTSVEQNGTNAQQGKENERKGKGKEIILESVTTHSLEELMKQNIDIESFVLEYNSNKENILKELKAFYLYWSEKKQNGKKERWQMEKTFDVGRRFHKRMSNSGKWDIGKKQNMVIVDF